MNTARFSKIPYAGMAKPCKISYASMAQLVEQRIRNAQVVGSSPTTSFIPKPLKTRCFQGLLFIYAYIPFGCR